MATKISKYFLGTTGSNYSIFDLDYALINYGENEINFKGSAAIDNVYVGNGFTFDFTQSQGGTDKLYLKGASSDYNYSYNSEAGVLSLTHKTIVGTLIRIAPTDKVVFTDGSISAGTIASNLPVGGASLATGLLNATEQSSTNPNDLLSAQVSNNTLKAFSMDTNGTTFAQVDAGVQLIVKGGGGVDLVYVTAGSQVNASQTGGGTDKIFLTGAWADYTKTYSETASTLTLSRSIGGNTEQVIVATGDRLVFADGAISTTSAIGYAQDKINNPATPEPALDTTLSTPGLTKIVAYAESNSGIAPDAADYTAAGVTGIGGANQPSLAQINAALADADVTGSEVDTSVEIQGIVNAYAKIVANADGTPNNNATNPSAADYDKIGVTGVAAGAEETLLGDIIDGKTAADIATPAQIQTLANAVKNLVNYDDPLADAATAPTKDQLNAFLGGTTVSDANLPAVLAAIDAANSDGAPIASLAELQTIANAGAATAAAQTKIAAYAQDNGTANPAPSVADYTAAGVTGIDATNLAAMNAALASAPVLGSNADTTPKTQAIADALNKVLAEANGASGDSTAADPVAADYAALGATLGAAATDPENLALLNDIIGNKVAVDVDTPAEITALADLANRIALTAAGQTASPALTVADLTAAGLTGVTPENLVATLAAIAATPDDGSGIDSLSELQTVATQGAAAQTAALGNLSSAAEANTTTATTPAATLYAEAGITGVDASNLAAINDLLNSAPINAAATDTVAEVQAIVDAYAAITAGADNTNDNDVALNQAQATALGLSAISTPAELALLNDILDNATGAETNTAAELTALASIADRLAQTAAGQTPTPALTAADLTLAGLTSVTASNLPAVLAGIAATLDDGSGIDSLSELQAIIATLPTAPALTTQALDGVTNFDVHANLTLSFNENVTAVAGKTLRIINDAGPGIHGENTTNSFTIDVADTSKITIVGNKVTINPGYDLDFGNNYHIEIDAGAFTGGTSGATNTALSDATALNFRTVTPETASVATDATNHAAGSLSQALDANGALVNSYYYVDIEDRSSPDLNTAALLNAEGKNYAFVATDYSTYTPDVSTELSDGNEGIATDAFFVRLYNFGLGDLLYVDTHGNNADISQTLASHTTFINSGTDTLSGTDTKWKGITFAGITSPESADTTGGGYGGYIQLSLAPSAEATSDHTVAVNYTNLPTLLGTTDINNIYVVL